MRIVLIILSVVMIGCVMNKEIPVYHDAAEMVRFSSNQAIGNSVQRKEHAEVLLEEIRTNVSEIYSIDERVSLDGFSESLRKEKSSKAVFSPFNDGDKILVVSIDSDVTLYLRVNKLGSVIAGVSK